MAGKRGNSEGTIRKRSDGRWEARIVLTDGKRKSLYGKTRQDVSRQLDQAKRDREGGLTSLDERQTVGRYVPTWLEKVRHTVEITSYMIYEREVRLRIVPMLGQIHLAKLTAQQVQTFYARTLEGGLSAAGVRRSHVVLHAALDDAVRLGLVHRNVADMVDVPRIHAREMTPLSEDQARALLAAAVGNRLEALYVLALATGMRKGEILALKWRDVDLANATAQVRATLRHTKEGLWFARPKTRRSNRSVALSPTVVEALRRHRAQQVEERLRLGSAWTDMDLVFPNTIGKPIVPCHLLLRQFRPLLRRAGLPIIRFHDLRHTAATLLLSKGINVKVVSEMLGHSNVSVTLNVYGHVLPHMQQQAADVMDKMLWGS